MSGHSKWAQIKRQKSVTDAARSRIFSRYARLLTVESKKAGGVVSAPNLASAIARAKAVNMPKENIERAIAKGTAKDAGELLDVLYEAYGPGGVAILIEAVTDSKNRTTQELKHLLSQHNVELASPGAASWAFSKAAGLLTPNEPLVDLGEEDASKIDALLTALDDHDDIQRVVTNARGYESTEE